ncbi:MAG: amino acid ABC transporter ATP-binding/permease protein [Staphylococcus haemolyticus]|uniref:Amino acid ABC transporter ATP-binding/permease protein n=1 Tax=Staphylococcus haemolyticus TaxID=1283 RepID=A0A2K0A9N3_STAHA|nr:MULTISPECIES: amino acid ABC transporter ATP-binding/permease protein [Staphylococcus]KGF28592.1 cysteine ABC transporter ATP-binding protein [Staphylococcus haemolyticus DNF00585]MCH4442493.1 amino acid ABC transporter ATP-binding/permease protein [Staphylococcus haemolyticus]MDU4858110.1 amino acid ABC transporter ATP-binding/permease protein [Staphylococcus haemolyticus]OFK34454.1 cysteine ABC transporter ATP-binding protein [Staphylococcus sp. HMSC065C10]OFL86918.1 cysteine ABC transpor
MKPQIRFRPDKDLILAILTGVIGSVVALAMFFLSGYMVTQSALGAPLYALMVLVVSVKLFGFIRAIARYGERLLSHKTTFTMLRDVRVQFLETLIPRVPNLYRQYSSADLLTKMISKVEALQNIYLRVYYPPVVIGFTAIIAAVTLVYFSVMHAIVIIISMLCSLWLVPWLSAKRAGKLKQQVAQQQQTTITQFYDYKEGYAELNRFNNAEAYREDLMNALESYDKMQSKETRFLTLYDYMLNIIAMIAIFATLALGFIQVKEGQLNVVYLTSIVLMMLTLFEQTVPMSNFAYYKADTDETLNSLNDVLSYPVDQSKQSLVTKQSNVYNIRNVSFSYEHQELPTLSNINLTVGKGEKVAIVGPSGSGKSTLLQIMSGLYDIDEGQVSLDGQNISQLDEDIRFEKLNVLLQSQQLFDGTLRYNMFSSKSDDVIQRVLTSLNLGYLDLEKTITLDGNTLSGGEMQRIALGRLFLKGSPIWLLDEPTTALDEDNTKQVMQMIDEQVETLVIATHDLKLLPYFDKIVVLIDGQIKEQGSYDELSHGNHYLNRLLKMN